MINRARTLLALLLLGVLTTTGHLAAQSLAEGSLSSELLVRKKATTGYAASFMQAAASGQKSAKSNLNKREIKVLEEVAWLMKDSSNLLNEIYDLQCLREIAKCSDDKSEIEGVLQKQLALAILQLESTADSLSQFFMSANENSRTKIAGPLAETKVTLTLLSKIKNSVKPAHAA